MRWWRKRKQQNGRRPRRDHQAEAAMKILDQFERDHPPENRSTDGQAPKV